MSEHSPYPFKLSSHRPHTIQKLRVSRDSERHTGSRSQFLKARPHGTADRGRTSRLGLFREVDERLESDAPSAGMHLQHLAPSLMDVISAHNRDGHSHHCLPEKDFPKSSAYPHKPHPWASSNPLSACAESV
jgi:hypothetical protein